MTAKRRDKAKDRAVPIPKWWLEQANDKLADREWTQVQLVDAAQRLRPSIDEASIDRGSISRLLRGERTTWALSEVVRRVLDLPPFEFFAVDGDEAWRIVRLQRDYRKQRDSTSHREGEALRELERLEDEIGVSSLSGSRDVVETINVSSGGTRKRSRAGGGRSRAG